MAKRITKQKTYITLPEETIEKIETMVSSWSYDTARRISTRWFGRPSSDPRCMLRNRYALS